MWPADAMRRGVRARVLHIAVGARSVEAGLFDGATFESTARVELASSDDALAELSAALSGAIASLADAAQRLSVPVSCQVVLSDFWLHAVELPWSPGLAAPAADVLTHIRAQFEASGWEVADGDCIRWDTPRALQPLLAVLYPARLLEAIASATRTPKVVLESIRPFSELALELAQVLRPNAVSIVENDISTFVRVRAGRPGEPAIEVTAEPHAAAMAAWRRSALLFEPIDGATVHAVLDISDGRMRGLVQSGAQSIEISPATNAEGHSVGPILAAVASRTKQRHSALDAVQSLPRRALVHAVTALALVSVTVLALQLQQSTSQLAELRTATLAAAPPPSSVPAPLTKAELSQRQRINEMAREINAPIGAVMAALKSPADIDVQVVSADVDAAIVGTPDGARRITVQAESHQPLDMERYVDYLASRPALSAATLVRHDLADGNAAALYRFTVEATWRP